MGWQWRHRVVDEWCRTDLVFNHLRLRSMTIIDLKLGKSTHAEAG
ncbi:MAG: DUF1016 domain-containing protein [Rhodothermaceae bacterium]|nr:DUF1016 domain-containing protein [Rhodothermaceae bacterium]MYF41094.1 DUF1016 domain-containing protein [Rhodothermaceae bacterium]